MTPDQEGAHALFEELGVKNEAIMKDNLKGVDGAYRDLLIMAGNVDAFPAQRQNYGLQKNCKRHYCGLSSKTIGSND